MAVIETQGFNAGTTSAGGSSSIADHPDRGAPAHRGQRRPEERHQNRCSVRTHVARPGGESSKGRDPRDALGIHRAHLRTGLHRRATRRSSLPRALGRDAIGIIPDNANIIRNLMHSMLYAAGPPGHFYPPARRLDWVDVVSAVKPDPRRTSCSAQSISPWPNSSIG